MPDGGIHTTPASSLFRVAYPGPFSAHMVVVDGWQVPFLKAHPSDDEQTVMLVLDDRFGETFTVAEAEKVVPFLAHAVAVALGYTCHPNSDEKPVLNPHPRPVRTHGIIGVQTEESDSNA